MPSVAARPVTKQGGGVWFRFYFGAGVPLPVRAGRQIFVSAEIAKPYRTPEILKDRRGSTWPGPDHRRHLGLRGSAGRRGLRVFKESWTDEELGGQAHPLERVRGGRWISCTATGPDRRRRPRRKADVGRRRHAAGREPRPSLLGAPYLTWNKAEACADFLSQQLPHLDIRSSPTSITKQMDIRADHSLHACEASVQRPPNSRQRHRDNIRIQHDQ